MKLACWVISLNPDAENTVKLLGSLQQQGISASLFPAVDGRRAMPALKNGERFNHVLAMIRHRKQLTSGELGCYLSHFRAVRKAYDEGYTHLCVLEDDVVIEPDFARVLMALLPNDNLDMVRFMALRLRPRKVIGDIADTGHLLTRPKRGAVGTQSYVLNRTGMKKFLDYAQTIYEPVDKLFDHFWLYNLKVYGVEPHTVYELDHATTIAKSADPSLLGPTLWMRLAYHPVKLWFSVRRHFHLLRHRDEYTPAVKSGKSKAELGRTSRIR
jgi:glycosyl transferase family 25